MYGTVDVSNNRKLETHSRHVMTFIFYDYAKEYFKHFVNGEIKKSKRF